MENSVLFQLGTKTSVWENGLPHVYENCHLIVTDVFQSEEEEDGDIEYVEEFEESDISDMEDIQVRVY